MVSAAEMTDELAPEAPARRLPTIISWVAAPLVMLALGITFFPSGGRDDLYIGLWPAYTLAHQGEIVSYNGEYLEQSSSLLNVLVLALLHLVTRVDLPILASLLAIFCGVAGVVAAHHLAQRISPGSGPAAALLTATNVFFVYWSFGRMESSLAAVTAVLLLLALGRYVLKPTGTQAALSSVAMLGFVMVRPETPFVLVCVLLGALATVGLSRFLPWEVELRATWAQVMKRLAIMLGVALVSVTCLTGARYLYTGSPLPQPAIAKAPSFSWAQVQLGLEYLIVHVTRTPWISLAGLLYFVSFGYALVVFGRRHLGNPYTMFALLFVGAHMSFVLLSGGDWMEGGRFLVPASAVAATFVALVINALSFRRWIAPALLMLVTALQIACVVEFAREQSTSMPIWEAWDSRDRFPWNRTDRYSWFERANRVHGRDVPTIEVMRQIIERIKAHREGPVTILSHQMGMVCYELVKEHRGRVQTLDAVGLTDRRVSNLPLVSQLEPGPWKFSIPYGFYFRHRVDLESRYGFPKVDVIFDLPRPHDDRTLRQHGYVIVYEQIGRVRSGSSWFPGSFVGAGQFVAVRGDLLPLIEPWNSATFVDFDAEYERARDARIAD